MTRIPLFMCLSLCACGTFETSTFNWIDGTPQTARHGSSVLNVRWTKMLGDDEGGPFVPIENARAAFDRGRDRLYVGSAEGRFYAFDSHGQEHFHYDPGSGIEAAPVIDELTGQIYIVGEDGRVHALEPDGTVRWVGEAGGAVRQTPVIGEDAIFLAREDDTVVGMAADSGEVFWSYRREGSVEYSISGHSGLIEVNGKLVVGLSDGTVVALNPNDGLVAWERITAVDVEASEGESRQFFDVDATPVLHEGVLYIASFTAGLYALDPDSGSVLWRDGEQLGITGMQASGNLLITASAFTGVSAFDLREREIAWSRANENGAPTRPVIAHPYVLVGESRGSLRALRLSTGYEAARIDLGTGFSGSPLADGRYGFALSNGGRLIAFVI